LSYKYQHLQKVAKYIKFIHSKTSGMYDLKGFFSSLKYVLALRFVFWLWKLMLDHKFTLHFFLESLPANGMRDFSHLIFCLRMVIDFAVVYVPSFLKEKVI